MLVHSHSEKKERKSHPVVNPGVEGKKVVVVDDLSSAFGQILSKTPGNL